MGGGGVENPTPGVKQQHQGEDLAKDRIRGRP